MSVIKKNRRSVPPMSVLMSVIMGSTDVSGSRVSYSYRFSDYYYSLLFLKRSIFSNCALEHETYRSWGLYQTRCFENCLGPALLLAFKNQLIDIIKSRLSKLKFSVMEKEVEECLKLSIIYDQPYRLDFIFENRFISFSCYISDALRMMPNNICVVLRRDNCKSVLVKHGIHKDATIPVSRQMEI